MTTEFKRPKLPDWRRMRPEEGRAFVAQFEGVFFAIPLDDHYGFGRVLHQGVVGCYLLKASSFLQIDEIEKAPFAFYAAYALQPVLGGRRWKILGKKPLEGALAEPVKFFREDIFTGCVRIYYDGEEHCYAGENLGEIFRHCIMYPEHVELDLRAYLDGTFDPSKSVTKYDPDECRKERLEFRAELAAGAPLRNWVVAFLTQTTEESLEKFRPPKRE